MLSNEDYSHDHEDLTEGTVLIERLSIGILSKIEKDSNTEDDCVEKFRTMKYLLTSKDHQTLISVITYQCKLMAAIISQNQ